MNTSRVTQIIQEVIRNDADPPSEDYSPYDFGFRAANGMDEEQVRLLINESVRCLPGALAESFLNGVFDQTGLNISLAGTLLDALPEGSEIGSSAAVVCLLREKFKMPRLDLFRRLVFELERTNKPHSQDLYAFAIWIVAGEPSFPTVPEAPLLDQKSVYRDLIRSTLAKIPMASLTEYARGRLEQCAR